MPDLKARYGYGGFITLHHTCKGQAKMMRDDGTFFRNIEEDCWETSARLAYCDDTNVDVQVLSTVSLCPRRAGAGVQSEGSGGLNECV